MIDIVYDNNTNINEKHFKGYLYDSLVYRYIRARERMAELEYISDSCHKYDRKHYYDRADRDLMKFCQILNEAIGEHD